MRMNLSDGEWKLMSKLWESSPLTITQLTAALKEETGWSKHTVISMLSRLEDKRAVTWDAGVNARKYRPLLYREDAERWETRSFLDKVYGGRLGLMMSAMVDARSLTAEDVAELSAILEKAKGGENR